MVVKTSNQGWLGGPGRESKTANLAVSFVTPRHRPHVHAKTLILSHCALVGTAEAHWSGGVGDGERKIVFVELACFQTPPAITLGATC